MAKRASKQILSDIGPLHQVTCQNPSKLGERHFSFFFKNFFDSGQQKNIGSEISGSVVRKSTKDHEENSKPLMLLPSSFPTKPNEPPELDFAIDNLLKTTPSLSNYTKYEYPQFTRQSYVRENIHYGGGHLAKNMTRSFYTRSEPPVPSFAEFIKSHSINSLNKSDGFGGEFLKVKTLPNNQLQQKPSKKLILKQPLPIIPKVNIPICVAETPFTPPVRKKRKHSLWRLVKSLFGFSKGNNFPKNCSKAELLEQAEVAAKRAGMKLCRDEGANSDAFQFSSLSSLPSPHSNKY